jgi:hypothetical protein
MSARRSARKLFVAVLLGVLVGGGLMAVTPAGAEVSQAAATSWKKVWKKELKPLAAKTFYTKAQSDTKYASKADSAAAAAAAQSAANASTDSKLGGYYKKAESDAKYAKVPTVIRGTYAVRETASGSENMGDSISWGVNLASVPTVHYIPVTTAVPAGCSGTVQAPSADPGHLCIFEGSLYNASYAGVFGPTTGALGTLGGYIGFNASTGSVFATGSWAVGVPTGGAGGGPATSSSSGGDPASPGN